MPIGRSVIFLHDYTGDWAKYKLAVSFHSNEPCRNATTTNSSTCVVVCMSGVYKGEWITVHCDRKFKRGSVICKRMERGPHKHKQTTALQRQDKECHYNSIMTVDMCVSAITQYNTKCSSINILKNTMLKLYLSSRHIWEIGLHLKHGCKCILNIQFYLQMNYSGSPAVRLMNCKCDDVSLWLCGLPPRGTHFGDADIYFLCNDETLITKHLNCDGKADCYDESDESDCVDEDPLLFSCTEDENVHLSLLCDGVAQCHDQSDETTCPVWDIGSVHQLVTPQYVSCEDDSGLSYCTTSPYCFKSNRLCVYERTLTGEPYHCSNTDHLRWCKDHVCTTFYKCPSSYCVPYHLICDDVPDCPNGEDEQNCPIVSCAGLLRCRQDNVCVHPQHICDGIVDCPSSNDDEAYCDIGACPVECKCITEVIYCNQSIKDKDNFGVGRKILVLRNFKRQTMLIATKMRKVVYLDLSYNNITSADMLLYKFKDDNTILYLKLNNNILTHLHANMLKNLDQVKHLILNNNKIFKVYNFVFYRMIRISNLDLSHQKIQVLEKCAFCGLANLQYLNLSNNNISTFQYDMFVHFHKTLIWLNIKNNDILEAKYEDSKVLCKVIVITNDNNLCCVLSKHLDKSCILIKEKCLDKICQRKLPTMAIIIACYGIIANMIIAINMLVIYFHYRSQQNKHSILVQILSLTDMAMLSYYFIITLAHYKYGSDFIFHYDFWIKSYQCKTAIFTVLMSMSFSKFVTLIISLNQLFFIKFRHITFLNVCSKKLAILLGLSSVCCTVFSVKLYKFPKKDNFMYANCLPFSNSTTSHLPWLAVHLTILEVIPCFIWICEMVIVQHVQNCAKRVGRKNTRRIRRMKLRANLMMVLTFSQWVIVISYVVLMFCDIQSDYLEKMILIIIIPCQTFLNSFYYTFHSQSFVTFIKGTCLKY